MTVKQMTNYKVIPTRSRDGVAGIALKGTCDGVDWVTTNIVGIRKHEVRTQSGTVYQLSNLSLGLWILGIQLKRPVQYEQLVKYGIL